MKDVTPSMRTGTLTRQGNGQIALQPMPFWQSLLLFGIPAGMMALGFHVLRPALERMGISPIESFLASLTVPLSLLLAAALVTYHKLERRPLTWAAFGQRMRFPRLSLRDVLWSLGVFAVATAGYGLFSRFGLALVDAGVVPLPAHLPALVDPRAQFTPDALDAMAGGTLRGRWDIVVLYAVMWFFNIAGEELWWRGIILPRQELTHGRVTWLLHGVLWTLFHAFKWWDMIGLLPVCLAISFSAQRLKSNWPATIAHALINGLALVMLVAGAVGG